MSSKTYKWSAIACALTAFFTSPAMAGEEGWLTFFEKSGGLETPRYAETMAYFERLDQASAFARLESFGRSPEGRSLPLFIISADKAFTPEKAHRTGKPVILIQSAIHSGECEGKDAAMLLARDLLIDKKHPELFEKLIFLIIPIFNVDGHERFSPYNRINQNGPREMGWRVTSTRLNLNRDFMKADAPEMRQWLQMYHRWLPHLFYDCHTTDGMDYQYLLTFNIDEHDQFGGAVSRWAREIFLPGVRNACRTRGLLIGPYADLLEEDHPEKGFAIGVWRPMLSNAYATVCNRAGFLIETHSLKPYAVRVQTTLDFILIGLREIVKKPEALLKAVAEEDQRVSAWGRGPADTLKIPLQFNTRFDAGEKALFLGFRSEMKAGVVSGDTYPAYSTEKEEIPTVYYNEAEPAVQVAPPLGYLIPQGWQAIVEVLRAHGIKMQRLIQPCTGDFEGYRFREVRFRPRSYEGRSLPSYQVVPVTEKRVFPAGTIFVPMGNPRGKLIIQLLEPEAPDALVAWGLMNTIFEDREYFESYVMEPLAEKMMAGDKALAERFASKVQSDSAFAANPRARLAFFYQNSPWYDQDKDLYPIWRMTRDIPLTLGEL
ncbi:MAG TPA: M14 family metallopeptidase [bacterium]|nr:M14 family metallopeptidase [bacterium]HQI48751.1 M14 family metallopeptidase [bacterium]HQJ65238.1 M14 family metallopeptidase [bacterium]